MFISKAHVSRRTVLRGLGVAVGLPFLDAMVPAQTPLRKAVAFPRSRFVAIEMVHGAAGSTAIGRANHYWSPAHSGADFEFTPTLQSLAPLRPYVTIVSNTELHNAMSLVPDEDGPMADHARSSAVFLTAAHPKRTEGSDIRSGPSIDQLYARHVGRETRLASLQLCIEDNRFVGGCGYGYSCAYTNTISWASPNQPLPMERAPRAVFQKLFASTGALDEPGHAAQSSVLDALPDSITTMRRKLGITDRRRLSEYLDDVRQVEKRIQSVERGNSAGARALSDRALSVPDSFDEHVKLMFDLQALALKADITRVCTFKMGADRSQRVYPASGITTPFHTLSHHREAPEKLDEFARLNRYHVSKVADFLETLRTSSEGEGNILDHSIMLYGSPMGDSHVHEHRFLPLFLAGKGNGMLRGNQHVVCPEDTPMANVLLSIARRLGVNMEQIGDSTGEIDL
jgi:hypothetical protein